MISDGRLDNVKFFKRKRVLVTGHTGYKGAWLAAVLNYMGANAAGYALAPEPGCLYEKINGDRLIHSVTGSLLDSSLLEQTVTEIQPEIVIHLAEYGSRRDCLREPVQTFQTNLMGSMALLEALRKCPSVKSIVLESVNQKSEDKRSSPSGSNGETFGRADPYISSKVCMEYMVRDYRELYFQSGRRMTGFAVVRVGNSMKEGRSIQSGMDLSDLKSAVKEPAAGTHRLPLPQERQSILGILDSYLAVGRLLYEKPAVYEGEWNLELMRECKSGLICEKADRRPKEFLSCRMGGDIECGICMKMISAYYGN